MLDGTPAYEHAREGVTDPFPRGNWDNDLLRMRIDSVLAASGVS